MLKGSVLSPFLRPLVAGQRGLLFAMLLIVLLAWIYLLTGAGTGMRPEAMTTTSLLPHLLPVGWVQPAPWSLDYALLMALMWFVMMAAMMLPSAASVILLYARIIGDNGARALVFLGGYLAVWLGFSLAATLLQYTLEVAGLLHAMRMWSASHWLSALVLVAAGVYQLTPVKEACLKHCQSPAAFLSSRRGRSPAYMGLIHGVYCTGCCWALMLLLFMGGVMNLLWVAGLSLYILIEKVSPPRWRVGKVAGVMALLWGCAVLLVGAGD